ncbi:MAG: signal recognition particle-docking protein FtsY [Thiotrichales bacterium]|nr:MAG: signal recognition particle-docking protein FtsY [Thiotrichales bacterium]
MSILGVFKRRPAEAVAKKKLDVSIKEKKQNSSLKDKLLNTSKLIKHGIGSIFLGKKKVDAEIFEKLEEALLTADVGTSLTYEIIDLLTKELERKELKDAAGVHAYLKDYLYRLLAVSECDWQIEKPKTGPYIILLVGVNGSGKTTTAAKLAQHMKSLNKSVLFAAGDTFRAAAIEQLQAWGESLDVPVISQHAGADSASVIFDAIQAAKKRNIDVLIADTAGRLQNKTHLMKELEKIKRVINKVDVTAPHEIMLVIDANNGQNAMQQTLEFNAIMGLNSVCITKLDGTAKGGIVLNLAKEFELPIRFLTVGERAQDFKKFRAKEFVDALLG